MGRAAARRPVSIVLRIGQIGWPHVDRDAYFVTPGSQLRSTRPCRAVTIRWRPRAPQASAAPMFAKPRHRHVRRGWAGYRHAPP